MVAISLIEPRAVLKGQRVCAFKQDGVSYSRVTGLEESGEENAEEEGEDVDSRDTTTVALVRNQEDGEAKESREEDDGEAPPGIQILEHEGNTNAEADGTDLNAHVEPREPLRAKSRLAGEELIAHEGTETGLANTITDDEQRCCERQISGECDVLYRWRPTAGERRGSAASRWRASLRSRGKERQR